MADSKSRVRLGPAPLVDGFGRLHDRLRVSVTDRCNLRCFYCMPAEGAVFRPRAELLTYEEIETVVRTLAGLGIRKVRLTGGEPLVRTDLPVLAAKLSRIDGVDSLGVTTNGLLLERLARPLRTAGVDALNISLDALDEETFAMVTRRPGLDRVLAGIDAARQAGFPSIKVNAVAVAGITDGQLVAFGRFARKTGLEVRFIEYMPLDAESRWEREKVLPAAAIIATLEREFGPLVHDRADGPSPATRYRFADGCGRIGLIPSVTEPFCASCNRFRLTADGKFRNCLFSLEETDIRGPLRDGRDVAAVAAAVEAAARECIAAKWAGHHINLSDFRQPDRPMYSIGG